MPDTIQFSQTFVLATAVASFATCVAGATIFFTTMAEGKGKHFWSTEMIVEFEQRYVQEILDIDTSVDYRLKIGGVQVDRPTWIAWYITVRYREYLFKEQFKKYILENRDSWNEARARPLFWLDAEWRRRAKVVAGLPDLGYVERKGDETLELLVPFTAQSWQEKVGITGKGLHALVKDEEQMKSERKRRSTRVTFAQRAGKGANQLAKLLAREHGMMAQTQIGAKSEAQEQLDRISGLLESKEDIEDEEQRNKDENGERQEDEDTEGGKEQTANCRSSTVTISKYN